MKSLKLFGEINEEMVRSVAEYLEDAQGKPVQVLLHSLGGESYSAMAISELFTEYPGLITINAIGTVQSAAVLVLAYGDSRYISKSSWVMVHEDSDDSPIMNTSYARTYSKHMKDCEIQWAKLLAKVTKETPKKWYQMHKKTTYLTAEQAIKLGLADFYLEDK